MVPLRLYAPDASSVQLVTFDDDVPAPPILMRRDGDHWVGEVGEGTAYGVRVDGQGRWFDPAKVLLDPRATRVHLPARHARTAALRPGIDNAGRGPLAVAEAARPPRPVRRSQRPPIVYETHVNGYTRARDQPDAGTYRGLIPHLGRLADLGISVIELMPVHQADPDEGSYWGYMPLSFGAVEGRYAAGGDPAGELAELVDAAHAADIEIWLDVVFNHTTEVGNRGPTYSWRGLADEQYYRHGTHGRYIDSSGCGNDIDVRSPASQALILWALDRLADLGVAGFRFDLAAVLTHDLGFVGRLDEWGHQRGVRLIAEPWDAAGRYQGGRQWPGRGWSQWNDRFRDDVRNFLRGNPGAIPALQQRVQGSPDLFDAPREAINYLTAHDGFTLYDLVSYDRKHNEANGEGNRDGSNDNRSWNCGWEGDEGVPDEVMALRRRQLRNAWCLLALSHGVPMAVAGDEFGRTQGGNNNPYNQDNETSWVDWARREHFADLERFVGGILALRRAEPVFADPGWWGDRIRFSGSVEEPDLTAGRSVGWQVGGLIVLANSGGAAATFRITSPGPWCRVVDTGQPSPGDIDLAGRPEVAGEHRVEPHTVVVLRRA